MYLLRNLISDFLKLFIPSKCLSCGLSLLDIENYVCKNCLNKIPKTLFSSLNKNVVSEVFYGRVNLEYATSAFFFTKEGTLQNLIHQIKYKGAKELAFELGKEIGYVLLDTEIHSKTELIIPVPLHKIREKKRGYNQSFWLAKGVAEVLNKPYKAGVLERTQYTTTQTRKTREQRWENVKDAFVVNDKHILENKHILLIDDVVTTGATLEACASKLQEHSNVRVSIASLAYAAD